LICPDEVEDQCAVEIRRVGGENDRVGDLVSSVYRHRRDLDVLAAADRSRAFKMDASVSFSYNGPVIRQAAAESPVGDVGNIPAEAAGRNRQIPADVIRTKRAVEIDQ